LSCLPAKQVEHRDRGPNGADEHHEDADEERGDADSLRYDE
jgi:hypothetical protein